MKPLYFLAFFFGFLSIFYATDFLIKKETEQKNWQFLIKNQVGAKSELNVGKNLTFDQDSIFFIDGKGLLHSLNKQSGRINWLKKLNDHSPFEIKSDDEFVYVTSFDSHVYQIDKKNGYISWSYSITNQFWPDTEVIFDDNDELVFFADRGGFLYALNRKTGQEIWKKEFGTIDNNKAFIEKSIHFGFLKQEDDKIIVDHFPSKTTFIVNKKSGEILDKKDSILKIDFVLTKEEFVFDKFKLKMEQNIISQPTLNLFDQENNLLWSYRTENRINPKEIYQDQDRIYYLNADNTILESIKITKRDPNSKIFSKINFSIKENFSAHHPYKNSNPQTNSEEIKYDLFLEVNKKIQRINYLFMNFKELPNFSISQNEKQNYLELTIVHDENFYENIFNDIQIEATFENLENSQKIEIKGFYYDNNTWKIRTKLEKGKWDWKIKIKTKFLSKKISGSTEIKDELPQSISIYKNNFILKNKEVFFPTGIQEVIADKSRDGNDLNNMDYAKKIIPEKKEGQDFLNFPDYLDLYKQQANLNIFRYGPDNWAPSIWENLSNKKSFSMSIKGNLQGDRIVEELQNKEFRIMMSIFAFYPPYTSKEGFAKKENRVVLEKYLDYVIARYSASIDIWELTNEAAPILEWQNFISDYLFENDPYKHPITTNLEETKLKNSDLLSIHLYIKKPVNNLDLVTQVEKAINRSDWQKAIIVSEFGFQGSNYFEKSADWLRKFSWIMTMQNIGIISWNTGYGLYENPTNGNVYLGPQERGFLKALGDFMPKIDGEVDKKSEFKQNSVIYTLKNSDYDLYYLLNLKENEKTNDRLELKKHQQALLEIIDPKTNNVLSKKIITEEDNYIYLPEFIDDLAVKITYQKL